MCHGSIIKWISAYYQKSQLNFLSSHFDVWTIDESVTHACVSLCVPRDCVGNRKLVWSVCVCVCVCVKVGSCLFSRRQFARRNIFSLKSIVRQCGEEILHEQERNPLQKRSSNSKALSLTQRYSSGHPIRNLW